MSEENEKKTTTIDFDTPPDQQEIRVLFVVKYENKNKPIAQYLTRRGWTSEVVTEIPELIGEMSSLVPHFVLISVNHPNKKVLRLPTILTQTFNARCIMFAEEMNTQAMRKLQSIQTTEVWKNSVSGPSAQRNLIQAILKMQGGDDEDEQSSSFKSDDGPDRIEIKGKNQSQDEMAQELMRLMQDDDDPVGASSQDSSENSYQSISSAEASDESYSTSNNEIDTSINSISKEKAQNQSDSSSSNNNSVDSMKPTISSSQKTFKEKSSKTNFENQSSDAPGRESSTKKSSLKNKKKSQSINQNMKGASNNESSVEAPPKDKVNSALDTPSSEQEENTNDERALSKKENQQSTKKSDEDGNSKKPGVIIEEGANNLKHSAQQRGANNLSHSEKQQGANSLKSKTNADESSSKDQKENKSKESKISHDTTPGTADILSEVAPEPIEKDFDEGKYNEEVDQLKQASSKKLVSKTEDLKQFFEIVEKSFVQVCSTPREKYYSSKEMNNVASINIKSSTFAGHLVVSFAKQNLDEVLLNDLRSHLIREAQLSGLEIDVEHPFSLKVKLVNHIDFTENNSTFCLKGINSDEEITISFIENDTAPITQLEPFEDKLKVSLENLCVNYSVNFTAYMYLKRNNKFYMYLKEGNTLQQKQLEKLLSSGVEELYIGSLDFEKFKEYTSCVFINRMIYKFLSKESESAAAA